MINDKIQGNTVMNSDFLAIFRLLLVKLCIQLSDLREMTSHGENKNEAVLLFSRLLIVASLSIVCTCMKMVTQRPHVA